MQWGSWSGSLILRRIGWNLHYKVLAVLGSQGDPRLAYRVGCPLGLNGQVQILNYTLPLPPGSSSSPSPSLVPSQLDDGLVQGGWVAEELIIAGSEGTDAAMGVEVPPPQLSRVRRGVRQLLYFRDFVTYQWLLCSQHMYGVSLTLGTESVFSLLVLILYGVLLQEISEYQYMQFVLGL